MSSFEIKIRVAYLLYWPIFAAEIQSFEGVCECVCVLEEVFQPCVNAPSV